MPSLEGWYDYLYRPSYPHIHHSWLAEYLSKPKAFPGDLDEPPRDLVDRVLFDERQAAREAIESINKRMRSRWHVFRQNMYGIDLQECIICTTMDNLHDFAPYRMVRRRQGLEQELHQLKKERRDESRALWEDISKLEAELVEAGGEYRTVARNEQVIGEGNGDG